MNLDVRPSVGRSGQASPQYDKKCINFAQGLRFSQDLFGQIQENTGKAMKHFRAPGSEFLIRYFPVKGNLHVRPSVGRSGKASPQYDKKCMNFAQGLGVSDNCVRKQRKTCQRQ